MRVWKKGIIISLILIFIVQIFSPVVNAGLEPVTDEDQEAAIRDLTENKLGGASSSAVPSSGTPSASAGSSGNTTGGTLGSVTEEDQEAAIRDLTENKLNGMSSVQDQASKLVSATTNGVSKLGDTALSWGLGILYLPFQYIIGIVTTILESVVETVSGKENITPGDILFNNVQLVDINFFSQDGSASQVVQTIRANVAGWYYGIRTIAIIALLSVLIYIAIRMIISTTGEEKGRYKEMLKDWLVSFALLFVLHYIMMLIIYGNNTFVEVIKRGFQAGDGMQQFQSYMQSMEDLKWNPSVNVPISQKFGSNVICLFMAGLTLAFIIMYLKRFIVVAFLMMIAPLITITYAIDKVRDKRSQALDTWRKEFFWTVLIQPFHCIIYLMFVPAALQLVANGDVGSSFMAIVFMTFILQAEDIVKNIFQIDNKDMGRLGASTALAVGGFMGSMKLAGSATKSVANTVNTGKNMNNANRVKVAATPTQASSGIKSTNKSTNTTEIAPASAKATAAASSNERGNGRGTTETQTNNIERKENSNGKGKLTTDAIMQQNEKFMESDKYRSSFERFANALTNSKALGFSGKVISGYTKAGLATALGALSLLENPSGGKLLGGAAVGYGLGSLTEKAVAGANNLTVRSLQKHVDDGRLRNRKDDFDNSYNEYIANGGTPESARKTVTKLMDADLNTINDDTKDITEIERKMAASAQRLFDQMKKMDYDEPLEEILQRTRRTKKA